MPASLDRSLDCISKSRFCQDCRPCIFSQQYLSSNESIYVASLLLGELFLMTGEICSLMGTAISQYYYPQSPFSRRIFINGSGRRTAEPSTVAAAAAQATLTELLLYLAKRLQQRFPGRDGALGMTLTSTDLITLERIEDDFIDRSVIPIVGSSVSGGTINSPTHRQIVRNSGKWALHITETPIAWGIHALYILITVGFQVPLVQTLFRSSPQQLK